MKHRAGYVSILGRPNVGKSTFLNEALGVKISITSPKAQTTRHRILGILSKKDYQILFMDTPGILHPAYLLQEYMMRAVEAATTEADVLLYMVMASDRLYPDDESYLQALAQREQPLLVLINKVDLIQKGRMLPLMEEIQEKYRPAEIIPALRLSSTKS
jgi:GTP-binding protein Era